MTATVDTNIPLERRILARALEPLRKHAGMDMVFGGPVQRGAVSLEITDLTGVRTRSAVNLVVRNGEGLGGKALMLGRPASVADYFSAQGITHVYDHAVRPEAIETLAALPIVVDRTPRILIYLAARTHVRLGDRWFDSFIPLVRRLERDIAVEDEVSRRLSLMRADAETDRPMLSRADLHDIAQELAELAGQIQDDVLRARLEAVGDRFAPTLAPRSPTPTALRPREIDVLEQVACGLSNREVAETLGLRPETVKSYLKSAMRKLHATNRVQAMLLAREHGLIR
ncbi:LuxR C-terminal-related transcriptional regulator (plasmid) [Rhodococcus aetherivorans]|uniref:helix-turn-helix transcriptional regulator n=1 Tax=Rhodococcus aetherivorans TaxID=191292 RepID=UPI0026EB7D59|nr:LuxR C-terminal-related transcriptional regulator [Rhodococcus aetherivorans]WKX01743.1 LuxR C-terminal-related transcriptional regulator [Rhodococcus aetherivorans]